MFDRLILSPSGGRVSILAIGLLLILTQNVCRAGLSLVDVWPAKKARDVCADAPLRLTCSESPVLGSRGRLVVYRVSDNKPVDVIDLGAATFTNYFGGRLMHYEPVQIEGNVVSIHLHAHCLGNGEAYRVELEPGFLKDAAGGEFEGLRADAGWTFTTQPAREKGVSKLVVAAGGGGDFCTLQGAVDYVADDNQTPVRIFVRNGTYDGLVYLMPGKDHIHFTGEDRKKTIVRGFNNDKFNPGRMGRALVSVDANDFSAENLTFRNTTPYRGSQAEAVRIKGEKCVLRDCDCYSFQDTLLLSGRVYVTNCYIEGDVDFIWGQGAVFFEQCEIKAVHAGYYLQSRNPQENPGYIFLDCRLTAAPDVKQCWLARIDGGRFPFSQAAFIHCRMGAHIPPAGWMVTGTDSSRVQFTEFHSTDADGKILDVSHRHPASRQLTETEAAALSDAARVFSAHDAWNPRAQPPSRGE